MYKVRKNDKFSHLETNDGGSTEIQAVMFCDEDQVKRL
jgi:hypothetical protein